MREKLPGEIEIVRAEHSATSTRFSEGDDYSHTADKAIDMDLSTTSTSEFTDTTTSWLKLHLDKVRCISRMVEWNSDGSIQYTWTCTNRGCSDCSGPMCEIYYPLRITKEGPSSNRQPDYSDCIYGDTVKIQLRTKDFVIGVAEIAVVEREDPVLNLLTSNGRETVLMCR